ncbi:MAG: hypothetical protein ACI9MC_001994 [Kiritimatiellia bacterium]
MQTLLLTAPMTQLNTPYPAVAYLAGFLRSKGHSVEVADMALELALRLFSRQGLDRVLRDLPDQAAAQHASVQSFVARPEEYLSTVDAVIRFLQGREPSLAYRIVSGTWLPAGPRFEAIEAFDDEGDPLAWAFGALGLHDRARYLATLYLADLADLITWGVDPQFSLVRYGERLASSAASFDGLHQALTGPMNLVAELLRDAVREQLEVHEPDLVGISVPFAGNMYGALRIAAAIKEFRPNVTVVLGGGYPNTELRELSDARVFEHVDHIVLDAGERPLLQLLEGGSRRRTFSVVDDAVVFQDDRSQADVRFEDTGTPSWAGLRLDRYLGLLDLLNPMHRLWSDTGWNKLTVAHGCYWKGCSFCDLELDYIKRYEPASANMLVDRMQEIIEQTGRSGFHFVDEAAPPRRLRELARELDHRDMCVSWWGNIRFERSFTPEVCAELAASGCVAVSGGLEVASDRVLKLMNKGVTVPQVARVTRGFADSGVMVHAYLMYGFPSQTLQETVDALEMVRQLFEAGCVHSAFWHRFVATMHSPVGREPERFGVRTLPVPDLGFAKNDVDFVDSVQVDHDALGPALDQAVYNYMHGLGLDRDVVSWFDVPVPPTTISPEFIWRSLDGLE